MGSQPDEGGRDGEGAQHVTERDVYSEAGQVILSVFSVSQAAGGLLATAWVVVIASAVSDRSSVLLLVASALPFAAWMIAYRNYLAGSRALGVAIALERSANLEPAARLWTEVNDEIDFVDGERTSEHARKARDSWPAKIKDMWRLSGSRMVLRMFRGWALMHLMLVVAFITGWALVVAPSGAGHRHLRAAIYCGVGLGSERRRLAVSVRLAAGER